MFINVFISTVVATATENGQVEKLRATSYTSAVTEAMTFNMGIAHTQTIFTSVVFIVVA